VSSTPTASDSRQVGLFLASFQEMLLLVVQKPHLMLYQNFVIKITDQLNEDQVTSGLCLKSKLSLLKEYQYFIHKT
jgi:hypothetical protein